jgi:uncharacterized protein (TIGR03083 family)
VSSAIDGLKADRDALVELCHGWRHEDWSQPSGCPGWTVQDLVAHMGALFWIVVDPARLADTTGLPTEEAQEVHVKARRSMTPVEVLADYENVSTAAVETLTALAGQDFELPLGDLGTYPASVVPTAFCFDHYVHIRADLFVPRGPLAGPVPPSDELRLAPTLDWVEAALPQQNRQIVDALSGAVDIVLTGPGARTITLGSGRPVGFVAVDGPSFVRCVTGRASWGGPNIKVGGDPASVDSLRRLHVF